MSTKVAVTETGKIVKAMSEKEKKKIIADYIKGADEGDLCVLACMALTKISLAYKHGYNKFKVYLPDQTYECSVLFLPPAQFKGVLTVSDIQSTVPDANTIKSLYGEWLKPEKEKGGEKA